MSAKRSAHPSRPPPKCKDSEVRPAAQEDERRRSHRRLSDAEVEILSPVQQTASVLDASTTGLELLLDDWLSAYKLWQRWMRARMGGSLVRV